MEPVSIAPKSEVRMRIPRWTLPVLAALVFGGAAWAANNFPIDTSGGTRTTISSTDDGTGVQSLNVNVTPAPSASSSAAIAPSATQAAASNSVLKASAGNLFSLSVTIGATAGWVMVFDAIALPSNGATTSTLKWCWPVNSDGTKGGIDKAWTTPISFATGITVGFSSTACNSLTASSTAFFYASVK